MSETATPSAAGHSADAIRTLVPARMDRLPWSRFHWFVLLALGVTWILDGLEVTLMGAVSGILEDPATLALSPAQIGIIGSTYVAGAVFGSLFFGWLTDRQGRKKLFFLTMVVYLAGVVCTAFSWNVWSFAFFRFLTGAGIGGEYAAINSAIDELIPARLRGRIDLMINGSYWLGAAFGSLSTIWLLDPNLLPVDMGWRLGFLIGGVMGLIILFFRKFVPESPRWLVIHGRNAEAENVVTSIETQIEKETGKPLPTPEGHLYVKPRTHTTFTEIAHTMFTQYRQRSILSLVLMGAQAFLYNAIFFTYALVLTKFYDIPGKDTGIYLLPFAIGNFLGPIALGHWFDTIGRRKMITFTYGISAVLLTITGYLFAAGYLTAVSQTVLWTIIFFFASAAASAAYLTVSEVFPLEVRGMAIAFFYSLGTGIGGILAPWIFGEMIGTGSRDMIFYGYSGAAVLMFIAAIAEWKYGVDAEGKCLEEIARPLACVDEGVPAAPAV